MTVKRLQSKAKEMKIPNISKMKKTALVWAIQAAEGNDPCFSKIPECVVMECCFRSDCIPK